MPDETLFNSALPVKAEQEAAPRTGRPWKTYFIQGEHGGPIKIGRAINPGKRLSDLQCGSPARLQIIGVIDDDRESELHQRFAYFRTHGEWFEPAEEILEAIRASGTCTVKEFPEIGDGRPELQLMISRWVREYGGEWNSAEVQEEYEMRLWELQGWLPAFDGLPPEVQIKCRAKRNAECECPDCLWYPVVLNLSELPVYGMLWDPDRLYLMVFVKWPHPGPVAQEIMDLLAEAFNYADRSQVQIEAVLVKPSGKYTVARMSSQWAKWLRDAPYELPQGFEIKTPE